LVFTQKKNYVVVRRGGGGGGVWGLFPIGSLRILTLAAFTQWLWAHKLGQRDKLTTARS